MLPNAFLHKFAVLIGAIMIVAGVGLGLLALNQLPTLPGVENSVLAAVLDPPESSLVSALSPPQADADLPPADANTAKSLRLRLAKIYPLD